MPFVTLEIKKLETDKTKNKICVIGQSERCNLNGCEWQKLFKICCSNILKVEAIVKQNFRPPEDFKPFYPTRRKKLSIIVKDEKKDTEIKHTTKNKEIDFTKITTAKPDYWLSKIKVLK